MRNITSKSSTMSLAESLLAPFPALARFARQVSNRQGLSQLRSMDDRMLDDIGLTRADVDRAFQSSWYHDPSADLSVSRVRRRMPRF